MKGPCAALLQRLTRPLHTISPSIKVALRGYQTTFVSHQVIGTCSAINLVQPAPYQLTPDNIEPNDASRHAPHSPRNPL